MYSVLSRVVDIFQKGKLNVREHQSEKEES